MTLTSDDHPSSTLERDFFPAGNNVQQWKIRLRAGAPPARRFPFWKAITRVASEYRSFIKLIRSHRSCPLSERNDGSEDKHPAQKSSERMKLSFVYSGRQIRDVKDGGWLHKRLPESHRVAEEQEEEQEE